MRVVNLSRERTCTHYCGRISSYNVQRYGTFMDLGNQFFMRKESERAAVIAAFEDWVRNDPGFVAQGFRDRIKALPENAVLGCWCKPAACHVDVIVKIWKELNQK